MAGYKFGNKANFGENTTLSGNFQYVFGSGNTNVADYTVVGGLSNGNATTSEHSFVWGSGNLVSGSNTACFGRGNILDGSAGDFNLLVGINNRLMENADYHVIGGYGNSGGCNGGLTYGAQNLNDVDKNGMGYQLVGGSGNTVSGANYGMTTGKSNIAHEDFTHGLQIGESGSSPGGCMGSISTAAGAFAAKGDAQLTTHMVYRGQTTDNTSTAIYIDESSGWAWDIAANDSIIVKATVIGRKAGDAGQSAAYEVIAAFKNQGGTTTIGTTGVTKRVLNEDTGTTNYDATLAANDTDDTFELKVTGDTGHNVNWMAHVEVLKLNVA